MISFPDHKSDVKGMQRNDADDIFKNEKRK